MFGHFLIFLVNYSIFIYIYLFCVPWQIMTQLFPLFHNWYFKRTFLSFLHLLWVEVILQIKLQSNQKSLAAHWLSSCVQLWVACGTWMWWWRQRPTDSKEEGLEVKDVELLELHLQPMNLWASPMEKVEMLSSGFVPLLLPCSDPFEDSASSAHQDIPLLSCYPFYLHLCCLLASSFVSRRASRKSVVAFQACLKIAFFVCVLFLPLWCSGLRWVASGCPSARPIKTDSSCRCLKTVADRVTQQFTAISGEKSVCPYGHRVELFLISECERNDSLVSVFQGSSTPTVAKRFWFLSSFFGQSKWIFYITNHHMIQRLQSQQFEQSVLQPKWRQKTSLLLHWIFKK